MHRLWECRYSSCEMMYLELSDKGVHMFLDHAPNRGDWYTLDDVTAGKLDAEVRNLYGQDTLDEFRAAVAAHLANPNPKVETKDEARIRRRREG